MSWISKLRGVLGGGAPGRTGAAGEFLEVKVRCRRCGEIIATQVNLRNDLSVDYEHNTYHVRKLLVGSGANRCFANVEIMLTFDENRRLIDRQIVGGTFVDEEEVGSS